MRFDRETQPLSAGAVTPAPIWHTGLLVLLITSVATTGMLLAHGRVELEETRDHLARMSAYARVLVVEWCLALYVTRVSRPHGALSALIGRRWAGGARALGDVVLAAGAALAIIGAEIAARHAIGVARDASIGALLPQTAAERLAWCFFAASVAFCEELLYRGYLQQQFIAFTKRRDFSVVAQAVLFGIAHANQGLGAGVRCAAYGLGLGLLTLWRGSLIPAILCHGAIDLIAGL